MLKEGGDGRQEHRQAEEIQAQKNQGSERERDEIEACSDADHAGDRETNTKSTTGTAIFYNGALIDAIAKRQATTSLSSAESEIYALAETAKRMKAVAYRAEELGATIRRPLCIRVDNKAGISFQQSTNNTSRLLGCFDLRENWLRELRNTKEIRIVHIPTADNPADLFTKCHSDKRFKHLLQLIVDRGSIQ